MGVAAEEEEEAGEWRRGGKEWWRGRRKQGSGGMAGGSGGGLAGAREWRRAAGRREWRRETEYLEPTATAVPATAVRRSEMVKARRGEPPVSPSHRRDAKATP